jgi:arylsulfatase A-like enzyme
MPQLAVARRARTSRSLERNQGPLQTDPAGRLTPHPLTLLGLAVSLGLATGLIELAVHFIRRKFINPSSMGALQLNPQAYWMVPVSDVFIFGACGLLVATLAAVFRSRKASALGVFGLFFVSALAVLLTFRGLTALACSVFSAGLAYRLTALLLARPERPLRLVRRGLPALVALVIVLACLGPGREKLDLRRLVQAPTGSPNVLFIVLDTVRAQSLSAYGYSRDTSPNLTRLVQRGVRFDQARAPAAWTLPSHASMFTGRWPYELFTRPDRPLDGTYPTLAEVLRERGYATAGFVGNTYFCNRWFGLDRGFLHYEDVAVCLVEILRSSDMGRALISKVAPSIFTRDRPYSYFNRKDARTVNHDMLSWLDSQSNGRPFFAFLNYFDAHDPYISAEGAPRHFGLRPETDEEIAALRDWLHVDKSKVPGRLLQMAIDGYDDGIAYLDDQVGRLFAALDSRGLLENTLIVITADHGELHGEHNNFGHGSHLYRQVVEVPLLIVGPQNVARGKAIPRAVSLRELPATVVDLLGLPGPSPFPGRSLARCWADGPAQTVSDEEFLLTETSDELSRTSASEARARALMLAGKVYIRNKDGSEELYDLATDPAESRDLSKTSEAGGALARFREEMKFIDQQALAVEDSRIGGQLKDRSIGRDRHNKRASLPARAAKAVSACDIEELD